MVIFRHDGEFFGRRVLLSERMSKQKLFAVYLNNVGVRIKHLEGSRMLWSSVQLTSQNEPLTWQAMEGASDSANVTLVTENQLPWLSEFWRSWVSTEFPNFSWVLPRVRILVKSMPCPLFSKRGFKNGGSSIHPTKISTLSESTRTIEPSPTQFQIFKTWQAQEGLFDIEIINNCTPWNPTPLQT